MVTSMFEGFGSDEAARGGSEQARLLRGAVRVPRHVLRHVLRHVERIVRQTPPARRRSCQASADEGFAPSALACSRHAAHCVNST
ncbi:MAG TPA: hypothetical protein VHU21_08430 [Paraburkholderia sp.]|nr:hypothetical protein [Paraburkholderia sp.]